MKTATLFYEENKHLIEERPFKVELKTGKGHKCQKSFKTELEAKAYGSNMIKRKLFKKLYINDKLVTQKIKYAK